MLEPRDYSRAYDNTIDDRRCTIDNTVLDDCLGLPYTEEEIKEKFGVDFIQTPCNERLVFENAEYLGVAKIKNEKIGFDCEVLENNRYPRKNLIS